jgi:hypothetical protein
MQVCLYFIKRMMLTGRAGVNDFLARCPPDCTSRFAAYPARLATHLLFSFVMRPRLACLPAAL